MTASMRPAMATLATIQRFLAMASGNWVAALLYTAAVLRIADLLVGGPRVADIFND